MRDARAEVTAHGGGRPSATQRALIEQAVQLHLRLAVMDRTFGETATMTEHVSRTYLAWSNSYTRTLRQLGAQAAKPPVRTLAEHLADRAAARTSAAPTPPGTASHTSLAPTPDAAQRPAGARGEVD